MVINKNFMYYSIDMFPMTAVVAMFPSTYVSNSIATTHVETVCLMAKK